MGTKHGLAAVAAALVFAGGAHASTFDFSAGDPGAGGYAYNPSVPNAVFYGNSGLEDLSGAWGFTAPPDDALVAFIQNNPWQGSAQGEGVPGELTLTFGGLTSGARYDLSFYVESRPGYGGLSFTANGVWLATPSDAGWTLVTTSFIATGASQSIVFALDVANPGSDNAIGVAEISVNPVSVAAPEPATWAMMLAGFAGLGFAGLRQARKGAAAV